MILRGCLATCLETVLNVQTCGHRKKNPLHEKKASIALLPCREDRTIAHAGPWVSVKLVSYAPTMATTADISSLR